jgi:hypothetical protein
MGEYIRFLNRLEFLLELRFTLALFHLDDTAQGFLLFGCEFIVGIFKTFGIYLLRRRYKPFFLLFSLALFRLFLFLGFLTAVFDGYEFFVGFFKRDGFLCFV